MPKEKNITMTATLRRCANQAVYELLKPTYFYDGVPLHKLESTLKDMGIVMIMEDNTEWSGMLCGANGECFIRLAPVETKWTPDNPEGYTGHGINFYKTYENAGLRLTWYKCTSRNDSKYEVIGYIS